MASHVGKVSRTAAVVWAVVSLGGCSAIAGLDSIQECQGANCPFDTGAPAQDSSITPDVVTGDSNAPETSGDDSAMTVDSATMETGPDTSMVVDSSPGHDGEPDTSVDSGMPESGQPDVKIDDAPFESACGDLNTPTNCGACGTTCTLTHANSAQCCTGSTCPGSTDGNGDACKYACQTGYLDCNVNAGTSNTDGCECQAPSGTLCCGSSCPTQHTTGLVGQSYYPSSPNFYDCVAAGTMDQTLAMDACGSYVTNRGGSASTNCGLFGPTDGGPPDSVCAITTQNCGSSCAGYQGDCICWTFSGTYKGQVLDPHTVGISDNQCYTGASTVTFN